MNRQNILNLYTVDDNGVIRTPGQFEGEMLYVPYFWDTYMDGFADDDDGEVLTFNVTAEDKEQFPELTDDVVKLYQRDDGFVCEVK